LSKLIESQMRLEFFWNKIDFCFKFADIKSVECEIQEMSLK